MLSGLTPAPQIATVPQKRGPKLDTLNRYLNSFYKKTGTPACKASFSIFLLRSLKKILKKSSDLKSANIKILKNLDLTFLEKELKTFDILELSNSLSEPLNKIETLNKFFHQENAKRFYSLIINQVLETSDYQLRNKRLELRCCLDNSHTDTCFYKSLHLKNYLTDNFLSDLELNNLQKSQRSSRYSSPTIFLNMKG